MSQERPYSCDGFINSWKPLSYFTTRVLCTCGFLPFLSFFHIALLTWFLNWDKLFGKQFLMPQFIYIFFHTKISTLLTFFFFFKLNDQKGCEASKLYKISINFWVTFSNLQSMFQRKIFLGRIKNTFLHGDLPKNVSSFVVSVIMILSPVILQKS